VGTSTTHPGPTSPQWTKAKSRATTWAKGGGGHAGQGLASVVAAAATALLGNSAAPLGGGGPAAAQRLGGLLSGIASEGLDPALAQLGLANVVGLGGNDLLAALVDYVAADGAGLEESAVRAATDAVISRVVEDLENSDTPVNEAGAEAYLELFWSRYLSSLILQALNKTLLDAAPDEAESLARQIEDHVSGLLEHHLDRKSVLQVDWAGQEGERLATQIRKDVLEVLGGEETS
jgi:hypothetical protein